MKEKRNLITIFLEWGTVISAFGLIGTVILQIVTRRFFVDLAPSWTEEASRFFFIYAISFGAGLAQKEGYFISMDYFYNKFNPKVRTALDLIISVITIILFLLMSIFSISFILLGTVETSPGLGFPMSIAFTSMLIMSGSVLYFLGVQLYDKIKTEYR
jgi:TRAP-type C4-dicarboxylate transport system permease small subunit